MSEGFTLADYRLTGDPATQQLPVPNAKKLWSRQVAADLIALAEAIAIVSDINAYETI